MTLDEAEAHVGNSVLIGHLFAPGGVRQGEIVAVDRNRQTVGVKVRRKSHPYDFLPDRQWWSPAHLSVPQWWLDHHEVKAWLRPRKQEDAK